MAFIKIQGEHEKEIGVYYQVDDSADPIGVGGMGQVFEGIRVEERTGVTRPVAIKFMFDDLPAQAIDRAKREASIQLRNDNLIEMLGFIEIDEHKSGGEVIKHYHVVSELLNGVSLSNILDGKVTDCFGQEIPFAAQLLRDYRYNPEQFAEIVVINILSGLMALHDAGFIHRDIDPSNIMVTSDGHIKLIDFGIAKQMNTLTTNDKSLTVAGKFMGKPEYAAPELALGDVHHQNQTTDIYAMGILLYQCIAGHTPFEGAQHEILDKQLHAKMPLDVIKNKQLRAIIAKACDKKQEKRFHSAAEMRVALENPESMNTGFSKNMIVMMASAASVVIVMLATILFFTMRNPAPDPVPPSPHNEAIVDNQTDAASTLNSLISKADQLAEKGFNSENDNYERALMDAYVAYEEAERMAGNDALYNSQLAVIKDKKQKVRKALANAQEALSKQAQQLDDIQRKDLSTVYYDRANSIKNFMNSH